MLEATPIQAQLAEARGDPLRVLVVGAGVAGATLAQLLRRQGLHPVLVERSAREADSGYVLALMPLVDPVLDALGTREPYLAASVGLDRYRFRNPAGRQLGQYSLASLFDRFGDYRGISRGELLAVLGSGGGAVTYGTTVTALGQRPARCPPSTPAGAAGWPGPSPTRTSTSGRSSGASAPSSAPTRSRATSA